MRSMAVAVQAETPNIEERSTRLLISYSNSNNKPSSETLRAAGLQMIQDYHDGSFLIVEPEGAVTSNTVDALMADNAVAYVAPDYIMSIPQDEKAGEIRPTATDSAPNDPYLDQLWECKTAGPRRSGLKFVIHRTSLSPSLIQVSITVIPTCKPICGPEEAVMDMTSMMTTTTLWMSRTMGPMLQVQLRSWKQRDRRGWCELEGEDHGPSFYGARWCGCDFRCSEMH